MDVCGDKKALRQLMIEQREKLPDSDRKRFSQEIFNKLEQTEVFQNSRSILLFWSITNEVHTHDFVAKWKGKKTIFLPVSLKHELKIRAHTGKMRSVNITKMTLFEPAEGPFIDSKHIELVIVPGLAFDHANNRLGYGKAYYDKLLQGMNAIKVGVCFNFQLLPEIPVTLSDQKMDMIITN